jgi:hypothetical protein
VGEWSNYTGYFLICMLLVGLVVIYYAVVRDTGLQPGTLPAGEYSTTQFKPGFSFHVSEGWEVGSAGETPGLLWLGQKGLGEVRFQNAESGLQFYDNSGELGAEHQIDPPPLTDNAVLWYYLLSRHPNLDVAVPRLVQVGGVNFFEYDVELSSIPSDYPQGCSRPCVPLFHYTRFNVQTQDFFLTEGNKLRILATVVEDEPVMIVIGATEQGFNGFVNEAAGLLGSVKWSADISSSARSRVPNLVGKTYDTDARLATGDFGIQVSNTRVTNKPKDTIINQDPDADDLAAKGSIIWVDVSAGQPRDPGDILDETFPDASSRWPRVPRGDGFSLGYSNNRYFISIERYGSQGVWADERALPGSGALTDSIIEVDATSSTAHNKPLALWGVTCRMEDPSNTYLLAIDSSGGANIWRLKDGMPSELADDNDLTGSVIKRGTATLTGVSDSVIKQGTATNHIRADCIGDTLTLYVNGRKVAEAENVGSDSGTVGLYVMNLGDQSSRIKVYFDNFQVSSTH